MALFEATHHLDRTNQTHQESHEQRARSPTAAA
jgi:hypothetical protein